MGLLVVLPSERDLLADRSVMHALDADVFSHLCERTDWSTGKIGVKSAVSYSRIASDLSETVPRKKDCRRYTAKLIENSVARSVKQGLLLRESLSGAINRLILVRVFWLELLTVDSFVKNPDGRQMGGVLGELIKYNSFNNSELGCKEEPRREGNLNPDGTYNRV